MKTNVRNLIIVDASGSMSGIYEQALAGMNETIKTIVKVQHDEPGVGQYVTLISFANGGEKLQYVYRNKPVAKVSKVTRKDYVLRGCTALYDAIGESVTALRRHVKATDKVLVTIITDGYENDSRNWTGEQVKQLIDELRVEGWVFTYIGANQDVEVEAQKMGVVNSFSFEATVEGTVRMFEREAGYRRRWNERVRRGETNLEEGYFRDELMCMNYERRVTPERVERLGSEEFFVFGSNVYGHHDGGAARAAMLHFGAVYGKGEGPQGRCYAIPTVGCRYGETKEAVQRFIEFARMNPNVNFFVTEIGCGHGGWKVEDMAHLFVDAKDVDNIFLPRSFWRAIA